MLAGVHKYTWTDAYGDRLAYVPDDITLPASDAVGVWEEFCAEASIGHSGSMGHPFSQEIIR